MEIRKGEYRLLLVSFAAAAREELCGEVGLRDWLAMVGRHSVILERLSKVQLHTNAGAKEKYEKERDGFEVRDGRNELIPFIVHHADESLCWRKVEVARYQTR